VAAVQLDEVTDQRQPEAEAAVGAGARAVGLPERLEHVGEDAGGDPLAGVGHLDLGGAVHRPQRHLHAAAGRRELHRVHQQVPHHLLQAVGRAHDGAERAVARQRERDVLGAGGRPHDVERGLDDGVQVHGLDVEPHASGDDPGEIEQVLDEAGLGGGVAQDGIDRARPRGLVQLGALQQARPPEDRVERRAQLVRHRGQQLVLRPVQRLGPQARLLLAREQALAVLLHAPPVGDVARDLGGAHDAAGGVPHR
jgi:hypothetical protein